MAEGAVRLIPGLNVEKTPTLNQAGVSVTSLARWRDGLFQKMGGWVKFFPSTVPGIPRDLHAWEDLNKVNHLSVGTTTALSSIQQNNLVTVTPQQLVSDFTPNFSTVISTPTVTIVDPNLTAPVTSLDSIYFNTPISVGGIILAGLYPITQVTGANSYQITATTNATATVNNLGSLPQFQTQSGSNGVTVTFPNHGLTAGAQVNFPIATSGNGVTIQGSYQVLSVVNPNAYTINAQTQATASGTFPMNGGNAELVYYIALGPFGGTGYGIGGYGLGGYGTGQAASVQQGIPITAIDWTSDNWGEILVACPQNGGIYYWDPTGGFSSAQIINTPNSPPFNTGIFVSTRQQILVAFGSTAPLAQAIGNSQDPMLVKWSDALNFLEWRVSSATFAGAYRIPIGSALIGGIATQQQNFLWTDLGLWAMSFIGQPDVFGFNNVASKCGLIGMHAVAEFRGSIYWMSQANFFKLDSGGVSAIPCPIWDAIFQDLDLVNAYKTRIYTNAGTNEIGWFFPSKSGGTGENDTLVKFNLMEPGNDSAPSWDYSQVAILARSAWIDQSVFGPPIGANKSGIIYQHETSPDADGQALPYLLQSGYFMIADGHDFQTVDFVMPDMKWGFFNGSQNATVQITLLAQDFPGDPPRTFGPFSVTQQSQFFNPRLRARQMAIIVAGNDLGSFVRMGLIRYKYAPDGKR